MKSKIGPSVWIIQRRLNDNDGCSKIKRNLYVSQYRLSWVGFLQYEYIIICGGAGWFEKSVERGGIEK